VSAADSTFSSKMPTRCTCKRVHGHAHLSKVRRTRMRKESMPASPCGPRFFLTVCGVPPAVKSPLRAPRRLPASRSRRWVRGRRPGFAAEETPPLAAGRTPPHPPACEARAAAPAPAEVASRRRPDVRACMHALGPLMTADAWKAKSCYSCFKQQLFSFRTADWNSSFATSEAGPLPELRVLVCGGVRPRRRRGADPVPQPRAPVWGSAILESKNTDDQAGEGGSVGGRRTLAACDGQSSAEASESGPADAVGPVTMSATIEAAEASGGEGDCGFSSSTAGDCMLAVVLGSSMSIRSWGRGTKT
jgi:hypothetical protein